MIISLPRRARYPCRIIGLAPLRPLRLWRKGLLCQYASYGSGCPSLWQGLLRQYASYGSGCPSLWQGLLRQYASYGSGCPSPLAQGTASPIRQLWLRLPAFEGEALSVRPLSQRLNEADASSPATEHLLHGIERARRIVNIINRAIPEGKTSFFQASDLSDLWFMPARTASSPIENNCQPQISKSQTNPRIKILTEDRLEVGSFDSGVVLRFGVGNLNFSRASSPAGNSIVLRESGMWLHFADGPGLRIDLWLLAAERIRDALQKAERHMIDTDASLGRSRVPYKVSELFVLVQCFLTLLKSDTVNRERLFAVHQELLRTTEAVRAITSGDVAAELGASLQFISEYVYAIAADRQRPVHLSLGAKEDNGVLPCNIDLHAWPDGINDTVAARISLRLFQDTEARLNPSHTQFSTILKTTIINRRKYNRVSAILHREDRLAFWQGAEQQLTLEAREDTDNGKRRLFLWARSNHVLCADAAPRVDLYTAFLKDLKEFSQRSAQTDTPDPDVTEEADDDATEDADDNAAEDVNDAKEFSQGSTQPGTSDPDVTEEADDDATEEAGDAAEEGQQELSELEHLEQGATFVRQLHITNPSGELCAVCRGLPEYKHLAGMGYILSVENMKVPQEGDIVFAGGRYVITNSPSGFLSLVLYGERIVRMDYFKQPVLQPYYLEVKKIRHVGYTVVILQKDLQPTMTVLGNFEKRADPCLPEAVVVQGEECTEEANIAARILACERQADANWDMQQWLAEECYERIWKLLAKHGDLLSEFSEHFQSLHARIKPIIDVINRRRAESRARFDSKFGDQNFNRISSSPAVEVDAQVAYEKIQALLKAAEGEEFSVTTSKVSPESKAWKPVRETPESIIFAIDNRKLDIYGIRMEWGKDNYLHIVVGLYRNPPITILARRGQFKQHKGIHLLDLTVTEKTILVRVTPQAFDSSFSADEQFGLVVVQEPIVDAASSPNSPAPRDSEVAATIVSALWPYRSHVRDRGDIIIEHAFYEVDQLGEYLERFFRWRAEEWQMSLEEYATFIQGGRGTVAPEDRLEEIHIVVDKLCNFTFISGLQRCYEFSAPEEEAVTQAWRVIVHQKTKHDSGELRIRLVGVGYYTSSRDVVRLPELRLLIRLWRLFTSREANSGLHEVSLEIYDLDIKVLEQVKQFLSGSAYANIRQNVSLHWMDVTDADQVNGMWRGRPADIVSMRNVMRCRLADDKYALLRSVMMRADIWPPGSILITDNHMGAALQERASDAVEHVFGGYAKDESDSTWILRHLPTEKILASSPAQANEYTLDSVIDLRTREKELDDCVCVWLSLFLYIELYVSTVSFDGEGVGCGKDKTT